jgi:hypothetical protein
MRNHSLVALALAALCGAAAAQSDPSAQDLARWQQASACVAVLKADVLALRDRTWSGTPGLKPEMKRLTEQGFAFIGTAYKQGLREPLADRLLEEAEAAQKRASADSLRALSQGCRADGARLLKQANVLERLLVGNRAEARVDKLLAR